MLAKIAVRGSTFKSAAIYYLHDKHANTNERVEFTHTENLPTNDPEKAWRWMAFTAINSDRLKAADGSVKAGVGRRTKPVYKFALAWHPDEKPERIHMIETARSALAVLGFQDHQTLMVAHNDRDHRHLHLMVNVVHPETGRAHSPKFSKLSLSKWAEAYEREHGKIYCEDRVVNNEQRRINKQRRDEERRNDPKFKGEKVKYQEPKIDEKALITKLYREAKDGKAFQQLLEKAGYQLAQGDKVLLIDRQNKIRSLSRQIEGAREKDVRDRLKGMKLQDIDTARALQEKAKEAQQDKREEEKREQEKQDQKKTRPRMAEGPQAQVAAHNAQQSANRETLAERQAPKLATYSGPPVPTQIIRLEDRQREEIAEFKDTNQRIKNRWVMQADRKYGAKEKVIVKEIAAHERELRELQGRRLQIGRRARQAEIQERLVDLRIERAVIEDYKIELRARDYKEAQEHVKGLQDLQKRHHQDRKALWDDPKAQLQNGREFNARSNPEKPEVEVEKERPLVELPATLQKKIEKSAEQTRGPEQPKAETANEKSKSKTAAENKTAGKERDHANENRTPQLREFNRAAQKLIPSRQEGDPANDNRKARAQEFNRVAGEQHYEADRETNIHIKEWYENHTSEAASDLKARTEQPAAAHERRPEAREFNRAARAHNEQQKAVPGEDGELYAMLDQKNKSRTAEAERRPEAQEFNQAVQNPGEQQGFVSEDDGELYSLLDHLNAETDLQRQQEREEQGSTHEGGQTDSGQRGYAPQDAELYAELDRRNVQEPQGERIVERDMSPSLG
jgi:hypothetical protein